MEYYAHSIEGKPQSSWQLLEDHLKSTARRAAEMAGEFGSSEWGYLAGLWHDLGKYQPDFQRKLEGERVEVEHSGLGATLAFEKLNAIGLSFAIAGHHGGLANLIKSESNQPAPLRERLLRNKASLKKMIESFVIPPSILVAELPDPPAFLNAPQRQINATAQAHLKRSVEMWTRFLFSALVDADRLNSEAFSEPVKIGLRSQFSSISELDHRLDDYLRQKVAAISPQLQEKEVNRARRYVLEACHARARDSSGIFSLVVPTGGGKTLSAMSFALKHAVEHNLHRVIVVIPYTSIIEQNAKEYRLALGDENVIEHHSNFDPGNRETNNEPDSVIRAELAIENWDAPVIITTSVQFLETLFSSRASRCRKLHNVARSVIILDEVQTLPPGMLTPILDAIQELTNYYGCSLVLSTATPPALAERPNLPQGLKDVRSIVNEGAALANNLKRVNYQWPKPDETAEWAGLTEELANHEQVLVVVHLRQDARVLAQELGKHCQESSVFHLSALMCPSHRLKVINSVKERLKSSVSTRVVATQLVEAGVDLDFPVVYRALGGLDSIVQAAGRCNREGRSERGKVKLFRAPSRPPPGTPRKALEITETMLRDKGSFDPDSPELMEEYFRRLYMTHDLDVKNIQREREEYNFATVGREFRLIEDGFTESVVVPYGDAPRRLNKLRHEGPDRDLLRSLQPFMVSVYPRAFQRLMDSGYLVEVAPSLYTLRDGTEDLYNQTFGLIAGDESIPALPLII